MKSQAIFDVYAEAQATVEEMSLGLDQFLQSKGAASPDDLPELDFLEFSLRRDDRDALVHHLQNIDESIGILAARLNITTP